MEPIRIFIVEDEPMLLEIEEQIILNLGHQPCGFAPSFDKAITGIARLRPELILVDIQLQGKKTGIDLGNYINQHFKLPFIYQSATEDTKMLSSAIDTNPSGYLLKPYNDLELFMAIGIIFNKNTMVRI